jgi:hypothetical protein
MPDFTKNENKSVEQHADAAKTQTSEKPDGSQDQHPALTVHQHADAKKKTGTRYRFHPLVRFPMLAMSAIALGYSIYFIGIIIPRIGEVTIFFKIVTVIILYVSLSTLIKHLTSLNSIIIRHDSLELRFLMRKRILIPWQAMQKMEIYKVITHYWRITYLDASGKQRIFKTSLAFPSIMQVLLSIQDHYPQLAMNDMLKSVLDYKRRLQEREQQTKAV